MKKGLYIIAWVLGLYELHAQTPAFPGAEGYGQYTTGGRGGAVYVVKNLNDNGPNSLRAAVEASGTRTVVFEVSGTIELQSELRINNDNITVAGQTAPGDGICIKAAPITINNLNKTSYSSSPFKVKANNVIIRYIRFRPGDEIDNTIGAHHDSIIIENDALSGTDNHSSIIIDHCSMSWANDEVCTFYDNTNITIQWCMITESLYTSYHSKGNHGYGGIWGGKGATFHHNLLAHHNSRNPRFNGARYHLVFDDERVDHRNNVIYNWGGNSAYGGEGGYINIVNNYYKYGPATSNKTRIIDPDYVKESDHPLYRMYAYLYINGNYVHGDATITADNWSGGVQGIDDYAIDTVRLDSAFTGPISTPQITLHSAVEAYEHVLASAGALLPKRDSIDTRIISETSTGTATFGSNGRINSVSDVGGWPTLHSSTAPLDTDQDGMPNAWEKAHSLDTANAADRNNDADSDGYTNLEEYLNALVDSFVYVIRPINLTLAETNDSVVEIQWDDISDNETGFVIERLIGGDFEMIAFTGPNDTLYYDSIPDYGHYTYRMKAVKDNAGSFYTDSAGIDILFVNTNLLARQKIGLECYPNPFNQTIHINYKLAQANRVQCSLYDITGQLISNLFDQRVEAGEHEVVWKGLTQDGRELEPGIYILTMQLNNYVVSTRIIKR